MPRITITICGSMQLRDRMVEIGGELENKGAHVLLPNIAESSNYSSLTEKKATEHKSRMIRANLNKIKKSDVILVVNEPLKGVDGYVGANTFLEMGFAYALDKKIYILRLPPEQANSLEIRGLRPIVLHGDLSLLNF